MPVDYPASEVSVVRRVLRVIPLGIVLCFIHAVVLAQPAAKQVQPQTSSHVVATNSSDYIGSETCATCHDEVTKKFDTNNPHARLALEHGGAGATCEGCHGPGKAHVDGGGDVTKIRQFSKLSTGQADEICQTCHADGHPNFERSQHAQNRVGCLNCHSIHASTSKADLLKVDQPNLCYTCHKGPRIQFDQAFHHKVNEGLMSCSDCHNPHGTFRDAQLRTTPDQNAICAKCHIDTLGPFAYEHPVVRTNGCMYCHSPHGSPNPRMLRVSVVNTLCLQCHSSINLVKFPNASSEQGGPVHDQSIQYVACTTCHVQIHGSNAAFNFFR